MLNFCYLAKLRNFLPSKLWPTTVVKISANVCISNHANLPAPVADAVGNIVEIVVNTSSDTEGDTTEDTVGTKEIPEDVLLNRSDKATVKSI